jgi:hypothetical protein
MKSGQKKNLESMDKYLEDEDIKKLQRPSREDYCYVIDAMEHMRVVDAYYDSMLTMQEEPKWPQDKFPWRPIPLKEVGINLASYHVAAMEQMSNTYRLYQYGEEAKGVFRGDNEMLVCESIPKDDEWAKFKGLLIYNEEAYKKAVKDWEQYWEWMENRNEARWVDQESGKLNYDQKNMMHNVRLLWSAENIALNGEPIVRFEGEKLETLRKIRNGDLTYEEIMELSEELSENMKIAFDNSGLPDRVDADKANKIYQKIQSKVQ